MFSKKTLSWLLAVCCLFTLSANVFAAEVSCDSTYCFTAQDFSDAEEPLAGICITDLPTAEGVLSLGTRILQPGDILTAEQISQMTFSPVGTETDREVAVGYLPIYKNTSLLIPFGVK